MDHAFTDMSEGHHSTARLTALLRGSTYASLLVEYGATMVPLKELSAPYLGCTVDRACVMAQRGELELPVIRMGGQRSPWLVHLFDLAQFIDAKRVVAGSANIYEDAGA